MLLKVGSEGEDVKKLQSKLGLNSDGDFGPMTESAVIKYQKENEDEKNNQYFVSPDDNSIKYREILQKKEKCKSKKGD